MIKVFREGTTYNHREVLETLVEFSAFKDRVEKKFKELAKELDGKTNEHDLWVNLYMVSIDYADEQNNKKQKQDIVGQKAS